MREKLSAITGANIEIGQPISHRIDAMLSGTQASIAIKLFGDDLNRMFAIGNQIKDRISGVEGRSGRCLPNTAYPCPHSVSS